MSSSSSSSQRPSESRFPCHYDDREARSSCCVPPAADWVNNNQPPSSSVMTRSRTGGESHFDFFYHAIFTFVHSALTILLAPVLKNTIRRPRRSSSPSRPQRATAMPPQSLHREVDPELAMPPQMMNYDRSSSNNNNSSILKSHQRRDSYQQQQQAAQSSAAAAKSVRFPEPKRSRPPLGRISSSIGSTSTAASSSTSASVSSSESSRSSSSLSSSSSSSSDGRGRISPWRVSPSPRTHHSTYFLSD